MALNVVGLIGIVVFYLAILGVGIWAAFKGKRTKPDGGEGGGTSESEDVMLAGRNIGLFVGMMTMTATWVGGGYINGTAESTYLKGLVWVNAPWCYSLSLMLGGLLFAEKMRSRKYVTMLDPFQDKYGSKMGGLLYIPAFLGDIFWSAAILAALGASISVVIDLNVVTSIVVSGAIAVSYTLIGGLYSVVYTDVVQLICIFIGLWLTVPFAMTHPAVKSISKTQSAWVGEWDGKQTGIWLDYVLYLTFGGIPWQVYFQRVLSCRTTIHAKYLSFAASFGCFISAIPAALIGAIAVSTDWNATSYTRLTVNGTLFPDDATRILPLVLQYLTPPAVSCIGLGAVSAAVMSSADSSTLSASSMFARNIYKLIIRPMASEKELLWVIRAAILGVGTVSTVLALKVQSVNVLFLLCSDLVYAILFPQLFCVIYLKVSNTYGAIMGYFVALFLRIAAGEPLIGFKAFIKYPFYDDEYGQLFPYRTIAMLSSLFTIVAISHLSHYLFLKAVIPLKYDYLKCFEDEPVEGGDNDIELLNYGRAPLNGRK